MFKKLYSNFIVAVLFFGIAISSSYALAQWRGPSAQPPAGNVDAPINTGVLSQKKLGALGIGGEPRSTSTGVLLDVLGGAMFNNVYTNGLLVATGTNPGSGVKTKGKVLVAIDDNGTAEWRDISELVPESVEYYFGGIYGETYHGESYDYANNTFKYNGQTVDVSPSGSVIAFTNPFANNTRACPTGYKAYLIYGTARGDVAQAQDQKIFYCLGDSRDPSVRPVGSFGGAFGFGSDSNTTNGTNDYKYKNPYVDPNKRFTSEWEYQSDISTTWESAGIGCPTGYMPRRMAYDSGNFHGVVQPSLNDYGDHSAMWCYSTSVSDSNMYSSKGIFRGFYSAYGDWNTITGEYQGLVPRENIISGFSASCPPSEGNAKILGTAFGDWPFNLCYSTKTSTSIPRP